MRIHIITQDCRHQTVADDSRRQRTINPDGSQFCRQPGQQRRLPGHVLHRLLASTPGVRDRDRHIQPETITRAGRQYTQETSRRSVGNRGLAQPRAELSQS